MKILIIGGSGTIGKTVVSHFKEENEILIAGRTNGDVTVDIVDSNSIKSMFEKIGKVDAIICIAGEAKWADFNELTEDDYYIGLRTALFKFEWLDYFVNRNFGRRPSCKDHKCRYG